ncbi:MAG TPA: dienelactone hydrolase family protein, partial [Chloroflexota bacterium]
MAGRNVEFASNGGRASGYLSAPAAGSGPGVLVIQEWWGLNSHVRSLADRFAGEGFVALAPDLYHGKETREPDEAGKLLMALNVEQAARDLRGAAGYLLRQGGASGGRLG